MNIYHQNKCMGCLWQGLFSFHSEGSENISNLFVSSPLETMYPRWQINNIFLPDLYKQTLMEWIFFFSSIFLLCFFFKFDKLNFIAFPTLLFEIFNHFLYHKFLFSTPQYVNGPSHGFGHDLHEWIQKCRHRVYFQTLRLWVFK